MPLEIPSPQEFAALTNKVLKLEAMIEQLLTSPLALEWVTMEQAASLLGYNDPQTVSRMLKAKKLLYKQDGRTYQVSLSSIREYNFKKIVKQ